jgi:taurine dioxygenase
VRSGSDAEERYADMRRRHPPIEQPVVKIHPVSGRKVLYVNQLYTTRILGMSRQESAAMLGYLTSLATVPEWQVRFRWEPGSIAIWDNHAVQHYAINDYHLYPRLMHRVTIN